MSLGLVAYGDSDLSDTDSENPETDAESKNKKEFSQSTFLQAQTKCGLTKDSGTKSVDSSSKDWSSGYISDEDEFESVSVISTTTSAGTGTKTPYSTRRDSKVEVSAASLPDQKILSSVNSTSFTSIDELPTPLNLDNKFNINIEEEDLEEEVKPKAAEIENAPKPPGKKAKHPVKITIPALDQTPEDDQPKKKLSASTKGSLLFSLLPAPVHSAKKEVNRPLLPYSLKKKALPSETPLSSGSKSQTYRSHNEVPSSSNGISKSMSQFNALTGYDSDSEDEEEKSNMNFFSLDSSSTKKSDETSSCIAISSKSSTPIQRLQSEEVTSSKSDSNPNLLNSEIKPSSMKDYSNDLRNNEEFEGGNVIEQIPEPGLVNDAPLDFGSAGVPNMWSSTSHNYPNHIAATGPDHYLGDSHSYMVPSNNLYNLANTEDSEVAFESDEVSNNDLKQFMSDKEFQRLQGKRKRGLEESINFVEAKVDDYVDPSEVSKHFTEETEYVSHKSKDNQPTQQQRKKKQITYLAFQAKEKELELKNQWAMNRMTKKQTQSKYGF